MKHILIIEDERDIVELVKVNLEKDGYKVSWAYTGEDGLRTARQSVPDLILLDLMLPGMDGLEVCRRLREEKETRAIAVVMLTAKQEESDIVTGLEVGADDYITKPFSPRVLVAHIRAVLRRKEKELEAEERSVLRVGDLTIDSGKHLVTIAGKEINLTPTEFALLSILARRPGWVFSRTQLVDDIRGGDVIITDRAVDVQVAGLRKKLGEAVDLVETVRGVGYRFRET
jgi:two-component system phosphate regulon response regulator PhoB